MTILGKIHSKMKMRVQKDSKPAPAANKLTINDKDKKVITTNTGQIGIRHLMSNLIRTEELDGIDHLVAPTILICEGVHNSAFYPDEEIAKFPDSWNGRPVVIDHPDINGEPVTAGSKTVIEAQTVGVVLNCYHENGKLKGEVWINKEKCNRLAKEVIQMLERNAKMEVSTGLFTEGDGKSGDWEGEEFSTTVNNYRPDHLALLPNGVGACSWEDGGGLPRLNSKADVEEDIYEVEVNENSSLLIVSNELSHSQIHQALRSIVHEGLNLTREQWVFVNDVFDKTFIYGVEGDGKTVSYEQGYAVGANDEVTLIGDRVEVRPVVSYVPVNNRQKKGGGANDQGDAPVTKNKGDSEMDRKEQVTALIANSGWVEDDREMLTELDQSAFDRIEANSKHDPEEDEKRNAKKVKANADGDDDDDKKVDDKVEDKPEVNKTQQTQEEFLANAPDSIRGSLTRSLARDEQIKTNMIAEIKENKANPYDDDELAGMEIETLEKLIKLSGSTKVAVDFSLNSAAVLDVNQDEVPAMPQLCPKSK